LHLVWFCPVGFNINSASQTLHWFCIEPALVLHRTMATKGTSGGTLKPDHSDLPEARNIRLEPTKLVGTKQMDGAEALGCSVQAESGQCSRRCLGYKSTGQSAQKQPGKAEKDRPQQVTKQLYQQKEGSFHCAQLTTSRGRDRIKAPAHVSCSDTETPRHRGTLSLTRTRPDMTSYIPTAAHTGTGQQHHQSGSSVTRIQSDVTAKSSARNVSNTDKGTPRHHGTSTLSSVTQTRPDMTSDKSAHNHSRISPGTVCHESVTSVSRRLPNMTSKTLSLTSHTAKSSLPFTNTQTGVNSKTSARNVSHSRFRNPCYQRVLSVTRTHQHVTSKTSACSLSCAVTAISCHQDLSSVSRTKPVLTSGSSKTKVVVQKSRSNKGTSHVSCPMHRTQPQEGGRRDSYDGLPPRNSLEAYFNRPLALFPKPHVRVCFEGLHPSTVVFSHVILSQVRVSVNLFQPSQEVFYTGYNAQSFSPPQSSLFSRPPFLPMHNLFSVV